jgi:hypothetical protein
MIYVVNPEGKRPLGRPRRRWEDNIKMDLREVVWGNIDWVGLAQDRNQWMAFVSTVAERLAASQERLSSLELVNLTI